MRRSRISAALLAAAIVSLAPAPLLAQAKVDASKIGSRIDSVSFTPANGKKFNLKDAEGAKAVVVVFLSFDCPNSNAYVAPLGAMAKQFADKGVVFVGVCPTDDSAEQVARQASEFKAGFPVFKDEKLAAADAFKAAATPEAFVLDRNLVLRYRGRIDNRFAARLRENAQVTKHELKDAIDALLAGKPVPEPATVPVGCPIVRDRAPANPNAKVTYYRDALPVLQKNCQECHRPGEVGPFSLMTYKQAVKWADDIKDYTHARKMPPWKPVGGPGYKNARTMPDAEIATLAAWVDAGCPEGDPKDAPPAPKFVEGWALGEPDLVLSVPEEFKVGPSGPDHFRCFVLPTGLTEDKMIVAYQVRPGNPRVVHHSINFFDTTGRARALEKKEKERKRAADEPDSGPGYSSAMGIGFTPLNPRAIGGIGGWTPGLRGFRLPEGTGYLLPKGSDVVLQIHYHRSGRPETDRTRIGFYFAKDPKQLRQLKILTVPGLFGGKDLKPFGTIPAGESEHRVIGKTEVLEDCRIYSVLPHMHMLGKKVKVTMRPPGGEEQVLVRIDDWDYNWQESYFFREPIAVRKGTVFTVEAVFDNSDRNPNNPFSPPKAIKRGDQTTDEMLFGFIRATSDAPGTSINTRFLLDRTDYEK